MAVYNVPEEIKSPTRVAKFLYAQDFFFLLIYAGFVYLCSSMVSSVLKVPYYIGAIIIGFSLILPSNYNKKRKLWGSIVLSFRKDRSIYMAERNVIKQRPKELI